MAASAVCERHADGPEGAGWPDKVGDVRVRLPSAITLSEDELARLPVRTTDGHVFPLGQVPAIVRGDRSAADRTGKSGVANRRHRPDRGAGISAVADVKAALDKSRVLSPRVRYGPGGVYR